MKYPSGSSHLTVKASLAFNVPINFPIILVPSTLNSTLSEPIIPYLPAENPNLETSKLFGILTVNVILLILVSHLSPIILKYNSSISFNGSLPKLYLYSIL